MASAKITLDTVIAALRSIKDQESGKDILTQGLVRDLKVEGDGVSLKLIVKSPVRTVREQMESEVKKALVELAGATQVNITIEADAAKSRVTKDRNGIPGVKHIIAVSSGKGGVGKSTVSTNLAVALSTLGYAVGLLDSDVYGPNIPTMMGLKDAPPEARQDEVRGELLIPLENHGVKLMSMGFLTKGDQPMVWRGPMLHSVVSQFLMKVDWGNLDYLIVDMPPGTGDVQLSLTQLVPVSGAIVVTTPQEVSQQDVRKAILMFEKVGVPILGVVENMSYFVCDGCDVRHEIFGSGGGDALAEKFRTKLLAQLPLAADVRVAGDAGVPITASHPDSIQAQAFRDLARNVAQTIDKAALDAGTESGAGTVQIGTF